MKRAPLAVSVLLAGLLAAGWLGALHPAFDSIGHFRLHLLVAALVLLVALATMRAWLPFAFLAVVGMGSAALAYPALPGLAPAEGPRTGFTVAQQNLLYINPVPEQAVAVLARSGADVLLLQEVDGPRDAILAALAATYPAQAVCPFRNRRAVAILSRTPFLSNPSCTRGRGLVSADVTVGGRNVTFASLHALWPWPHRQWDNLPAVEAELRGISGPLVIAGDFNATPWSAFVHRIAAAARAKLVPGLRFTFNLKVLPQGDTRFGGLPIDHVLHSAALVPSRVELLPHAGSDHLGTLAAFGFAR